MQKGGGLKIWDSELHVQKISSVRPRAGGDPGFTKAGFPLEFTPDLIGGGNERGTTAQTIIFLLSLQAGRGKFT
jgi:hypothetical protein